MIKQIYNNKTPVWFLRQAGRYLPEYRALRSTENSFLELCYNEKKVSEITIQPIDRFDLDAAIIFSDILVIPDLLGWPVTFDSDGPKLKQFKDKSDLLSLIKSSDFSSDPKTQSIYNAINIVKNKLNSEKSLIGFSGSPWTIISYMINGKSFSDFNYIKSFLYGNLNLVVGLCEILTNSIIKHLCGQINAGADVVQLFDSWASILCEDEYDEFVIKPTNQIVNYIKNNFPHVKVIGFPRNSGLLYEKYINNVQVDVIGVDQFVPLDNMKIWQNKLIVQGNLDPTLLLIKDKDLITSRVNNILSAMGGRNFIFNLGHGILKETPVENVELVVNCVRNFR